MSPPGENGASWFSFPFASGQEQFWIYDGICQKRLVIVVSMAAKPPFQLHL
jgi:hypothetical protein